MTIQRDDVVSFSVESLRSTSGPNLWDFKAGRYQLRKHLGTPLIPALNVLETGDYAKQLLLEEASRLADGFVPLYVCQECADLYCGAIAVRVSLEDNLVRWENFVWDSPEREPGTEPSPGSDIFQRTGPFLFDFTEYRLALAPFRGRRPSKGRR